MIKILVVVDAQMEFIYGPLGSKEAQAAIPNICDTIENGRYDWIIITHDTHGEDYLKTQEGRRLPIIHGQKGTDGYQIHPFILKAIENEESKGTGVADIEKNTFGNFLIGNQMKSIIDYYKNEEAEIHFVGFCTGICVLSNAVIAKAACPEARICVIENSCACVTPETHKTAIEAMKTMQVDII